MDIDEAKRARVLEIAAAIFECDVTALTESSSVANIDGWDSMNHLKLMLALEKEFQLEFDEEVLVELLSVELIFEELQI